MGTERMGRVSGSVGYHQKLPYEVCVSGLAIVAVMVFLQSSTDSHPYRPEERFLSSANSHVTYFKIMALPLSSLSLFTYL